MVPGAADGTPAMKRHKKANAVFEDIAGSLPDWNPTVIFDVGANIGQSALAYASAFPDAMIHSFEPVPESREALETATASHPNITVHAVALGKRPGKLHMTANGTKPTNKVLDADQAGQVEGAVQISVDTGTRYTKKIGVDRISFLKIDTEGHDYDVLLGFLPIMDRIDFIQVEAAMNGYNKTHVPFRVMEDLLRHEGFHLFGFYDQTREFKRGGRPVLRRANPVFINGSLVDLENIR